MIKLNDTHKTHLSFLVKLPESVLSDFCRLAWDYISKGPNNKLYASAANKLEIDAQSLQHVVEALANLLVEACKHKVSQVKLKELLSSLGFSEAQTGVLSKFYADKQTDIAHCLLAAAVRLPTFKNLEWRVEAQLGRRALTEEVNPRVLLKLSLDNYETPGKLLETDPANLVHITRVLENALQEANSQHTRRVLRRFKHS